MELNDCGCVRLGVTVHAVQRHRDDGLHLGSGQLCQRGGVQHQQETRSLGSWFHDDAQQDPWNTEKLFMWKDSQLSESETETQVDEKTKRVMEYFKKKWGVLLKSALLETFWGDIIAQILKQCIFCGTG